jgi:branched-chain amino acid transport system substrate-binding protein
MVRAFALVRPRHRRGLVVAAAALLVVASCGDDDDGAEGTGAGAGTTAATSDAATTAPATAETTAPATSGTTAPPAGATTAPPAGATTAPPAGATTAPAGGETAVVTDYLAYVGGPGGAADASLAPIKVGYVNQEGGQIEIGPTNDDGVEIGVKFINEQAGGIGGHPIELVKCYIAATEEDGQQCGQELANDPDIVAVIEGAVAVGAESLFAALGDRPVVSGVSVNAVDTATPNAAVLFGGAQYILAPYATFARDTLGAQSAALIYPEAPGTALPARGQASAFEAAGIPIKVVPYPPDTSDLTVPLLAADAQNADVVMPVINPNDCVKFEQAVQQLGIPDEKVLASPICLTPTTIEGLGDFPKWIYAIASAQTFDTSDPGVPPYQEILTSQGQEALIGDPWVNVGFGQVLTLANWLNALGPDNITNEGIVDQMKAFAGPLALGSPVIQCGKYPEAPGVCNDHTQFYQWNGQGNPMTKAGDWVPPPEGWVAPN